MTSVQAVFDGFATIGLVIGLGILLAHLEVIDAAGQRTLSTLAFFVASPALLLTTLQGSSVDEMFSGNLVASAASVAVVVLLSGLLSMRRREALGEAVVGALTAGYVNAGNLGLPIAAYVLGSTVLVAPTLLLQLLVLQPLALTLLDVAASPERLSLGEILSRPFRNPITIGSLVGLGLALTHLRLPQWIDDPVGLIGNLSVPCMLLAYGVSLRLGPLPGRGVPGMALGGRVLLKLVVQPVSAYVIGRYAVHLDSHALLAVTVLAALPTAQNVFVMASRYATATLLARDVIFVSTIFSVPAIFAVSALLA